MFLTSKQNIYTDSDPNFDRIVNNLDRFTRSEFVEPAASRGARGRVEEHEISVDDIGDLLPVMP